jgi:hypothetical protein
MTRRFWFLTALSALFPLLTGCGSGERLPADANTVLDKADEIELFSVNPDKSAKKPTSELQGWEILGKTTLSGDEKAAIIRALRKGIAASDGSAAACFNPRHGIKATHDGTTVELVICFECLSISGYTNGTKFSVLTARSPESEFNRILTDKGVPLPKQRE